MTRVLVMAFADRPYYGEQQTRFGARLGGHPVVAWLLGINILVFVLDQVLTGSALADGASLTRWGRFSVQEGIFGLQLWRWVTYQFLHGNFFHLLFNMITLAWAGRLMEEWWGPRKFLVFYLLCGMSGALLFSALSLAPPSLGFERSGGLVGASGAIFGLLVGAAVRFPHMSVNLLLLPITLTVRWMAIIFVGIALLSVTVGAQGNGGQACHLGGAALGFVLVRFPGLLSWADWRAITKISPRRLKHKARKNAIERKVRQEQSFEQEVDRILDKVAQGGLQSLTWREKRTLQKATERQRQR